MSENELSFYVVGCPKCGGQRWKTSTNPICVECGQQRYVQPSPREVVAYAMFDWALSEAERQRVSELIRECHWDAEEAKRRFLAERDAAKDSG